jgi:hypothetical protein
MIIVDKENIKEISKQLKSMINGKNAKIFTAEVSGIEGELNPKTALIRKMENIYIINKYDKNTKEYNLKTINNNEEEELEIFIGDAVYIESDTKFSVVHVLPQINKTIVYSRDEVEIIEPEW